MMSESDQWMILVILLGIAGAIIGFVIARYLYNNRKWSDKKKAFDAEWRLKLERIENNHKAQITEINNNNETRLSRLCNDWKLKYSSDLAEIKSLIQSSERYMRYDAVKRSKRTLLGKLWEQVSPYMPKFPFRPSDMRFLGSPIDFIIFDGASEGDIKQVIFLEVKTGDSKLSAQERKLKQAIESGKVSWKSFNINKPEEIKIQEDEEKEEIQKEIPPAKLYDIIDKKIGKQQCLNTNDTGEAV